MRMYLADAFTAEKYRGNPAAVCLLDGERPGEWMQKVAGEMNQAETAFLLREGDVYRLRWFTPTAEVDLCGHATLASAHILWEEGLHAGEEIRFATNSGELRASRSQGRVRLDFPQEPAAACPPPEDLRETLGVPFRYVGKNRMDYLVELEGESEVRNLRPNLERLKKLAARGVIATARSDRPAFDFVSRCFFPSIGIDEDPVTGSAHCCLGPYWSGKLDKIRMSAVQLSARQGTLVVELEGTRTYISGHAVTTLKGELPAD